MDGLLRKIPARLLFEWMEFYGIEPFGREADDVGLAMVAMQVAAGHGTKKTLRLSEFMPPWTRDGVDEDELKRRLKVETERRRNGEENGRQS